MPMAMAIQPKAEGEAGEILGRIEWNTKAGKLIRVDRMKDSAGNWVSDRADISVIPRADGSFVRPQMLFDFHSALNGWVRFNPYDEVMVAINAPLPPRPPQYLDQHGNPVMDTYGKPVRHDQTVRVPVFSPATFGEQSPMRELSIKGMHAIAALGELFGTIEAAPEYAQGKIPLIRWDGARDVGKGNGAPIFTVVSWHDRPEAMPRRNAQAPTAAPVAPPTPQPAPQVVNQMPPPAPKPVAVSEAPF